MRGSAWRASLCLALLLAASSAGCCEGPRAAPVSNPGAGSSIADQVYTAVSPVPGEQAEAPDSTDVPMNPVPAVQRLFQVCKRNPAWTFTYLYDPRERAGAQVYASFRFRDRSVLTFVESPMPGKGNGTRLDSVEVIRP